MKKSYLLGSLLILLILTSCSSKYDECESIIPAPSTITISIIDAEGNSLIGEENVYKPSDISLEKDGQDVNVIFLFTDEISGVTFINLNYPLLQSGQDYILELNSEENVILNLDVNRKDGVCFDSFEIETFRAKGIVVEPQDGVYSIQI